MQNLDLLKQIAAGIQNLLGDQCEVVIHDFSDLEHSIVHIEGNVTGRSIGGAATDLILAQVHQGDTEHDSYNYHTYLPSGRAMKSCTVFLREDAQTYGAFCINFDITNFSGLQQMLNEFLSIDDGEVSETLLDDIQSTIHTVLMDTVTEMEGTLPIMGRDEKLNLIARLDKKGIFQVKKSVPILADELNLSRSTIYNYLSEIRGERVNGHDDGRGTE